MVSQQHNGMEPRLDLGTSPGLSITSTIFPLCAITSSEYTAQLSLPVEQSSIQICSMAELQKPIHTLILDTGPIILNTPPISSLLSQCEQIVTTPAILPEIRDPIARSRFDTTVKPFLQLRRPKDDSLRFVREFARKSGDLGGLSAVDLEVLSLAYELECEQNGGDWRLRRAPGQKRVNGPPPGKMEETKEDRGTVDAAVDAENNKDQRSLNEASLGQELARNASGNSDGPKLEDKPHHETQAGDEVGKMRALRLDSYDGAANGRPQIQEGVSELKHRSTTAVVTSQASVESASASGEDSDPEGWITPSNLKKRQARDKTEPSSVPLSTSGHLRADDGNKKVTLSAALLTTDFAMQNVALLMNLNLISSSSSNLHQIRNLRTHILRCHACFMLVKDTTKQFCPRCGMPALTKVSCQINEKGETKVFLKKKMQWNTRGDRYSIPKPVSGSANGRWSGGGGKGGWGQGLILAEDQKEYVKAIGGVDGTSKKAKKEKNLMDIDSLPSIVSGDRSKPGGRPRVGAGRNINSKKRR